MRALASPATAALVTAALLASAPALDAAEPWAAVGIEVRQGRRPAPGIELRLRPEGPAAADPAMVATGVTDERGRAVVYVQPGVWRLEMLSGGELAYFVTVRVSPGSRAEELGAPARDVDAPDLRWRYLRVDEPPPATVRAPRAPAPVQRVEPPPLEEPEGAGDAEAAGEAPPAADVPPPAPADESPADDSPADQAPPPAAAEPAEAEPADPSPSDSSPFDTIPPEPSPYDAPPAPAPAEPETAEEPPPASPEPPRPSAAGPPPPEVPAQQPPVERQPIPAPPDTPPSETPPSATRPAEPPVERQVLEMPPPAQPAPTPDPPPAEPELPPAPPRFAASAAGECPDCRPDEAAVVVERTVFPGGGPCGPEIGPAAVDAARRLAGRASGPQPLEGGGLGPSTGGEGCQVLGVVLPPGVTYRGYRYEVEGGAGAGRCYAGDECPVPGAAWPERPTIRPLDDGSTLVYGLFRNTAPDRARRARLTVYYRP